jgi:AraC-like DNA-binding protein
MVLDQNTEELHQSAARRPGLGNNRQGSSNRAALKEQVWGVAVVQVSKVDETELDAVPNGMSGYEAVVAKTYFPMTFSKFGPAGDFHSKACSGRIGPIVMSRMYATGGYCGRRRLDQGGADAVILALSEQGTLFFQGKRAAATRTGSLILLNANQPLEVLQEHTQQSLAMLLPARRLATDLGSLDDFCLLPVDSSVGAPSVLREMMLCYWRQRADIDPRVANEMLSPVSQLIGAAFREVASCRAIGSLPAQAHFLRARDLVMENLSNAELCAQFIADRLGISKSYLFAIMKTANTTLGRFILEARLERARQLLEFPATRKRSISEIAFSVGFQELAHFSRRFTQRFGKSPKAFRTQVCANSGAKSA